jgi:alpha-beta hydrolase superfamily lysophospholipase
MQTLKLQDSYSNELHTLVFDDISKPKGVIQVSHGLNEHGLRYTDFAAYCNKFGYIVVIEDHVSQGFSRTKEETSVDFGKHGDKVLIDGFKTVTKWIDSNYKDLPKFAVGHSLGTSIIRRYIQTYGSDFSKIVLNGGGYQNPRGMGLVIAFAKFLSLFGPKKPSPMYDNMFRKMQLRLYEKVEMNHFIEWLTRDKEQSEKDKKDPFLFISLSIRAYDAMLTLIKDANTLRNMKKKVHTSPILLLSGTHDAATNFGQSLLDLHEIYTSLGYNAKYKLYKEGRHDSFQELNRLEVYQDIIDFIGGTYGS